MAVNTPFRAVIQTFHKVGTQRTASRPPRFDAFRCFELKIALAGRKTPVRRRKNRFIFRFKYCAPVLISRSVIYSSILRHIMRRKFPKRFFRLFFRSKKFAPIRRNILNWHPVKAGTFVKREDIRPQAFSLKNLKTGSRT